MSSSTRTWFGVVLLASGVLGVLHTAGFVGADRTLAEWWPIAIVGWGIVRMLAARRIAAGDLILASIGVALLADEQHWLSGDLIWPLFVAAVGVALLLGRRDQMVAHAP